ncbi:MAG: hypothetical protein KIT09_21425 [Bryobacteraceae bacterium]|nr:hypothetical protein [Bryobacteraceae bacterium]
MIEFLWQASRGYRLAPWKSPYLRWRLETFAGVPADEIGFRQFWRQAWRFRKEFLRYLRWTDRMRGRYIG